MKERIIAYLQGPRRLEEGIALVIAHSKNAVLVRTLQRSRHAKAHEGAVMEELRKMAGLTVFAFQHMKRYAKAPAPEPAARETPADIPPSHSDDGGQTASGPVSDTLRKMINFRKRFPFLSEPDCPDVLKVLVADMFTAYGRYRSCHRDLVEVADDKLAPTLTRTVLDNYLEDRAIMAELEYYRDHGEILGKHHKVAVASERQSQADMSDFDLAKALKNAISNISKCVREKDPEKAESAKERLEKWQTRKEAIQAEIEHRQKSKKS